MKKNSIILLLSLHILLVFYSLSGIFSKLASKQQFLSFKFCFFYGLIILLLGVYAIGWQQIIKRLPLTTAFANKAITVVWGIIWGILIFNERITIGKIIGAVLVMFGVVFYTKAGEDHAD